MPGVHCYIVLVIAVCNKLKPEISNVETYLKFRKLTLNLDNGRPIFNSIYDIFNLVGLKYLTCLQLELSHLNEYKFKHNFQDCLNPLCSCSLKPESNSHFFLCCHYYTILCADLMNGLKISVKNIMRLSENSLVYYFLVIQNTTLTVIY